MSRFWAAASSSEGEQGSDSDSYDEAQPTQKLAEKKFGATFEESDSGKSWTNRNECIVHLLMFTFVLRFRG